MSGLPGKHKLILVKKPSLQVLDNYSGLQTMGRSVAEDPDFFATVNAAALFTGKLLNPSFGF